MYYGEGLDGVNVVRCKHRVQSKPFYLSQVKACLERRLLTRTGLLVACSPLATLVPTKQLPCVSTHPTSVCTPSRLGFQVITSSRPREPEPLKPALT
jgi:hypothetical protein